MTSSPSCRLSVGLLLGALALLVAVTPISAADAPNWAGEYKNTRLLNGQGVLQLSIEQEGGKLQVSFDAVRHDGTGPAPEGQGPAKLTGNQIEFQFKDSFGNRGTGTIQRRGEDLVVSIKATHVADPRAVVFYGENMPLKRVGKK